jgi:FAD/FMN-containing dehydrogenase
MLIPFPSEVAACEAVLELRSSAAAVEILSQSTAQLAHSEFGLSGTHERHTLLLVEFQGHQPDQITELVEGAKGISTSAGAPAGLIRRAPDPTVADQWWKARKTLLPRLQRSTRGEERLPYSVVNDVGVEPQHLSRLLEESESIFRRNELPAVIYGHAGSGNLHLRPLFRRGDETTARSVALDLHTMVTQMGGTVTAEHGMGRLRAPFLEDEWGERICGYMREVKAIFDPEMLLNPGVMFVPEGHDFASSGWAWPPTLD